MDLQTRIALLEALGQYIQHNDTTWQAAKRKAFSENNWFTEEFIDLAVGNLVEELLQQEKLSTLAETYQLPQQSRAKKIGVVMPGNIPLAGFYDVLCVFLTGNIAMIKPSVKDSALIKQLVTYLHQSDPAVAEFLFISELLKGCDAYIATINQENDSSFLQYFSKYPNIIRKKRTSVAVLDGHETREELEALSGDLHYYFGLGYQNVKKIYVPEGYDFIPLLDTFNQYEYFTNHHKYKNNYDYHLAMHILNNKFYMTNGSLLLLEDASFFAPVGQVHYAFYKTTEDLKNLQEEAAILNVVGRGYFPFGKAQYLHIDSISKGPDTINFLKSLNGVN